MTQAGDDDFEQDDGWRDSLDFVNQSRPGCQIYLLTPPVIDDIPAFVAQLEQALKGGPVAALQLRLKGADDDQWRAVAAALKPICAAHDIAFIVNDSAQRALDLEADGVHLGQNDGAVAAARTLLGRDAQIGVTCHTSRHGAMEAGDQGADYVAFGAFFPSKTKPDAPLADPALLDWWSRLSELPCVAIGGITPDNAAPLVAAGADFLAVCAGVWDWPAGPTDAVARLYQQIVDVSAQAC